MLLDSLGEGFALLSTGVAGVTVVLLVESLVARDAHLLGIDDNDEVARVNMRSKLRLVLATENVGSLSGNLAQHLVGGVDNDPLALNLLRLCVIRLHDFLQIRLFWFKSAASRNCSVSYAKPTVQNLDILSRCVPF